MLLTDIVGANSNQLTQVDQTSFALENGFHTMDFVFSMNRWIGASFSMFSRTSNDGKYRSQTTLDFGVA